MKQFSAAFLTHMSVSLDICKDRPNVHPCVCIYDVGQLWQSVILVHKWTSTVLAKVMLVSKLLKTPLWGMQPGCCANFFKKLRATHLRMWQRPSWMHDLDYNYYILMILNVWQVSCPCGPTHPECRIGEPSLPVRWSSTQQQGILGKLAVMIRLARQCTGITAARRRSHIRRTTFWDKSLAYKDKNLK